MFELGVLVGAWMVVIGGWLFPEFHAAAFSTGLAIGVVFIALVRLIVWRWRQ